ncbi:MAG: hypothetical protein LBU51_01420 [Bacteroidales bacterium]|jgi:hypothetical protein|nr:hypothetical protein [Bacteroidales bacterium]
MNIKNIGKLVIIIVLFSSCLNKKTDNENTKAEINGIELLFNDYEITHYSETKMTFYENQIQMDLHIKITNSEKLNIIRNSINSIIYINFNNKRNLAKGNWIILSSVPDGCDYFFPTDENGKIIFFEDNIIGFIGFKNK